MRGIASRLGFCAAIMAGLAIAAGSCGSDDRESVRGPVVERWDTLFVIGGQSINDTTLHSVIGLIQWGDRLAVLDGFEPHVRVFRESEPLWGFGRQGKGPGEFYQPRGLAVAPNGNLWVLDQGRITEISPEGEHVRDLTLFDLPSGASDLAVLHDRIVFSTYNRRHIFLEVESDSRALRSSIPFGLPDTLPSSPNLSLHMAATSDQEGWVAAFHIGPGFYVHRNGEPLRFHRYVDPAWFVSVRPDPQRDTARFAAHAVSTVGDEIYLLYGGRPLWLLHGQELPRWIDIYGLDGAYRRSYRLPFDSWRMYTDGEVFYVSTEDPYPAVFALKPK